MFVQCFREQLRNPRTFKLFKNQNFLMNHVKLERLSGKTNIQWVLVVQQTQNKRSKSLWLKPRYLKAFKHFRYILMTVRSCPRPRALVQILVGVTSEKVLYFGASNIDHRKK